MSILYSMKLWFKKTPNFKNGQKKKRNGQKKKRKDTHGLLWWPMASGINLRCIKQGPSPFVHFTSVSLEYFFLQECFHVLFYALLKIPNKMIFIFFSSIFIWSPQTNV